MVRLKLPLRSVPGLGSFPAFAEEVAAFADLQDDTGRKTVLEQEMIDPSEFETQSGLDNALGPSCAETLLEF